MIYNAVLFVALKAIEQMSFSETLCENRERFRLLFGQDTFGAVFGVFTFVTMSNALFNHAFSDLAPILVFAAVRMTAIAVLIFRAKAAGKSSPCNSQFYFHRKLLLCKNIVVNIIS